MPTQTEKIRVNYYVGAMLAQGGEAQILDSKIVFSPTSALDRAMGAKDVEISFGDIRTLKQSGELSRTFQIGTIQKVHKFEGSQVRRFAENLAVTLKKQDLMAKIQFEIDDGLLSQTRCTQCAKTLKDDYVFCPHCGSAAKSACKSCRRIIQDDWATCAYCGQNLNAAS